MNYWTCPFCWWYVQIDAISTWYIERHCCKCWKTDRDVVITSDNTSNYRKVIDTPKDIFLSS